MKKQSRKVAKRCLAFLMVLFLLSINSFAAVVSDNDGSAFITKAEFDSLKNTFQTQIDQYNTSIDSKIDGAIASYLAGIRTGSKMTIQPTFRVDGIMGMSGSDNNLLTRTKSDYMNINCTSWMACLTTVTGYKNSQANDYKTIPGVDTTYKCRLVDQIDNTNSTTKKHARWLGYQTGTMIITGQLDMYESNTPLPSGSSYAAYRTGAASQVAPQQAWGFRICTGTEESTWGAFYMDENESDRDVSQMVGNAHTPWGSSTSSCRGFPNIFGSRTTRANTYSEISKPYVCQFNKDKPKVENKDGYDWFCNDGGAKDWTTSWQPFQVINRFTANTTGVDTSVFVFYENASIKWNVTSGSGTNQQGVGARITNYPSTWTKGHFWGVPYKGYNDNIETMDDLYNDDFKTFIANLNSSNNCATSEQYTVDGSQVWCQSMGFPLIKVEKSGKLEVEFVKKTGATDYVIRICKGAQSKNYTLGTTIPYAVTNDLNGKSYDTNFGGFVVSGTSNKIKFEVNKDEIITLKVLPLNSAKTAFSGYIEIEPIEDMELEIAA